MERFNRTLREGIEEHLIESRQDAERIGGVVICHYCEERMHGALDFKTPSTWYRGNPDQLRQERRKKMAIGRHRRKQVNLAIRQPTLPPPRVRPLQLTDELSNPAKTNRVSTVDHSSFGLLAVYLN